MSDVQPDFASEPLRTQVHLFHEYGIEPNAEVWYSIDSGTAEAAFVLGTKDAATIAERELTLALMDLLQRKIWVTTDCDAWTGRRVRL